MTTDKTKENIGFRGYKAQLEEGFNKHRDKLSEMEITSFSQFCNYAVKELIKKLDKG